MSGLGSEDPNNRVLGPKDYNVIGIWAILWVPGLLGE